MQLLGAPPSPLVLSFDGQKLGQGVVKLRKSPWGQNVGEDHPASLVELNALLVGQPVRRQVPQRTHLVVGPLTAVQFGPLCLHASIRLTESLSEVACPMLR